MSKSLQPHGLKPSRLLCPWNFPGKSTGVHCHFLLLGIFRTQGLNLPLHISLHCQDDSLPCTTWEAWWLELQWLYITAIKWTWGRKPAQRMVTRKAERTWVLRNLWNYHVCMLICSSCVWLFVTLWTVAPQASLTMGFSKQEYWSGLPCLPPGDLPDPGIEPGSPALQADSLLTDLWGKPYITYLQTWGEKRNNPSDYMCWYYFKSQSLVTRINSKQCTHFLAKVRDSNFASS